MTLTYTKYYRFPKTDFMSEPWIQGVWDSFDAIDALMYGQAASNGTSVWTNSTNYVIGNQAIDPIDSSTWVCVTAHASAASPTTMAQDRVANPSYWNPIMLSFKARGQWTNNTAYNPGDMAYDTTSGRNIYGICTTKHVSNASGTINDDAAYWAFTYNSLAPTTASGIGYSNAVSHLVATNVQAAIDEVVVGSSTPPVMDGVASAGVLQKLSRGDHVHPTDTSRAPLNSPAFTGTPTAPTPPVPSESTTKIATTAFVQAAIVNITGGGAMPPAGTILPLVNATPAVVGTSIGYAHEDHVHPTDSSRVAKAGDTMTGALKVATSVSIGGALTDPGAGHLIVSANPSVPPVPNVNGLQVVGADNTLVGIEVFSFGVGLNYNFKRALGTCAAPTPTVAATPMGSVNWYGQAGTVPGSYAMAARLLALSNDTFADTTHCGTLVDLYTTPVGSGTNIQSMRWNPSGGVSIGTWPTDPGTGRLIVSANSSAPPTSPASGVQVVGADGVVVGIEAYAFGGSIQYNLKRALGTCAAPTPVGSGLALGSINWWGQYGTTPGNYAIGVRFVATSVDTFADASHCGTVLDVQTTPQGSGTNAISMRFNASGGVSIGSAAGVDPGYNNLNVGGTISTAGIVGTVAGDQASPGSVGEVISAVNSAGTAMTTGVPINVTTIALTAGDWDVDGELWASGSGVTASLVSAGITPTSANLSTVPATNTSRAQVYSSFSGSQIQILALHPARVNLSAPATYYLVAQTNFSAGSITATGVIKARRRR